MSHGLLYVLAAMSFCYFVLLVWHQKWIPAFGGVWIAVSLAFFWIDQLFYTLEKNLPDIAKWLWICFWIAMAVVIFCFFASSIYLNKQGKKEIEEPIVLVIVLGAKVNKKVPSKALQGRLMKAYGFLKEHPEAFVMVTGGKGTGEEIEEAVCMQQELLKLGIEKERIIVEKKSTTTIENIQFGKELLLHSSNTKIRQIIEKNENILVITSEFHVKRGITIAKEQGFSHVYGMGAKSDPVMLVHYDVRETLAWIKYKIIKRTNV